MSINVDYKKITPSDVFVDFPLGESQKVEELKCFVEVRPTGIEFLDVFFRIIKQYPKIPVASIAKIMHIDKRIMSNTVLALTGVHASDWINEYLFLVCCKLLRYSELPIIDIAKLANFSSASAFTQFFMRMQKLSPSDWRKTYQIKG